MILYKALPCCRNIHSATSYIYKKAACSHYVSSVALQPQDRAIHAGWNQSLISPRPGQCSLAPPERTSFLDDTQDQPRPSVLRASDKETGNYPFPCFKISPSGSSVHGIFQARVLEWIAIAFSRGSPRPRNRTRASRIAGRLFTI